MKAAVQAAELAAAKEASEKLAFAPQDLEAAKQAAEAQAARKAAEKDLAVIKDLMFDVMKELAAVKASVQKQEEAEANRFRYRAQTLVMCDSDTDEALPYYDIEDAYDFEAFVERTRDDGSVKAEGLTEKSRALDANADVPMISVPATEAAFDQGAATGSASEDRERKLRLPGGGPSRPS